MNWTETINSGDNWADIESLSDLIEEKLSEQTDDIYDFVEAKRLLTVPEYRIRVVQSFDLASSNGGWEHAAECFDAADRKEVYESLMAVGLPVSAETFAETCDPSYQWQIDMTDLPVGYCEDEEFFAKKQMEFARANSAEILNENG